MTKKYETPEEETVMASEPTATYATIGEISTADALWTLIKSQGKQVQKILLDRLTSLFQSGTTEVETDQHLYVKESLHRAFENMRKAEANGVEEQTLDDFLNEL